MIGTTETQICILGCGSSAGVPLVGHQWGQCDFNNPKNNRTRCGAMIKIDDHVWLIDVTPDFRQQAIRERIDRVDGVMLTHAHFDHIGGLDDLKPFSVRQGHPIPVWMDQATWEIIHLRYPYALVGSNGSYAPFLLPQLIEGPFVVAGTEVIAFEQDHGYSTSLGFRFPNWAYSTDVVRLNDEAMSILRGVKLWLVDCMGRTSKITHAHWDITMDWIDQVDPEQAVLIHMGTEMDYEAVCRDLPDHIRPAYDGMCLSIAAG